LFFRYFLGFRLTLSWTIFSVAGKLLPTERADSYFRTSFRGSWIINNGRAWVWTKTNPRKRDFADCSFKAFM